MEYFELQAHSPEELGREIQEFMGRQYKSRTPKTWGVLFQVFGGDDAAPKDTFIVSGVIVNSLEFEEVNNLLSELRTGR